MAKKKILIIDDDKDFTRLIKLNLESRGNYEVIRENDAKNAVATARRQRPDLILLDIIMPDVSGDEIADQLKAGNDTKDIPVIFLTAILKGGEADNRGGIIGGQPFVSKPVEIEKLISVIEENIG